ncbi:MAG: hypothetical protein Q7K65_03415 [Candidatus Buchananbacteria bacterium]|nr:hypothetical protein [Candidatus Buchananbacteria bacterium]
MKKWHEFVEDCRRLAVLLKADGWRWWWRLLSQFLFDIKTLRKSYESEMISRWIIGGYWP